MQVNNKLKRKYFLYGILLWLSSITTLHAGLFTPDSLRLLLNKELNYRQQVDVYQALIDGYIKAQNSFNVNDYQTALKLATDNNYQPGIARLFYAYVNFYGNQLPSDTLVQKVTYCINVFRNFSFKKELALSYIILASHYQNIGKTDLAVFNYIEAMHAISKTNESDIKQTLHLSVAKIYTSFKLYQEALYFIDKGLAANGQSNIANITALNLEKANIYLKQQNHQAALQILQLININELNEYEKINFYAINLHASINLLKPLNIYKEQLLKSIQTKSLPENELTTAYFALAKYYAHFKQSDSALSYAQLMYNNKNTINQAIASELIIFILKQSENINLLASWIQNYISASKVYEAEVERFQSNLIEQFFTYRYITDDGFESKVGRYAKFKPMFYITLVFFALLVVLFSVAYIDLLNKKNYQSLAFKKEIDYHKKRIEIKEIEVMQAKENIRESEKIKTAYVNNIVNDLQKHLQGIKAAQPFISNKNNDENTIEKLATAAYHLQNFDAILERLKSYNKISTGGLVLENVSFNLKYLLQNVNDLFLQNAKEKKIDFSIHIDNSIPNQLLGDPLRINQIFINLIGNAIKYTNEGYVHVNITRELITQNNILIHIAVKDTGIGIDESFHDLVFSGYDAHAMVNHADTTLSRGLGLAVTKKIVEAMGSKITLKSKPGLGTTFDLHLNFEIAKPDLTKKQLEAAQYEKILRGKKIMIIENDVMNLMVLKQFVQNWGIKPVIALNGEDAIKHMQNESFDMILVDMQLPDKGGFKTTKLLRDNENQKINSVPIIGLTTEKANKIKKDMSSLGMNDIVYKPYDPDKLRERMAMLFQNKSLNQETYN